MGEVGHLFWSISIMLETFHCILDEREQSGGGNAKGNKSSHAGIPEQEQQEGQVVFLGKSALKSSVLLTTPTPPSARRLWPERKFWRTTGGSLEPDNGVAPALESKGGNPSFTRTKWPSLHPQ